MSEAPARYQGSGNFVFVSYSHEQKDIVYDDIRKLQGAGINIWYDNGLKPGEEWYQDVEDHVALPGCRGAILYVSESFLHSKSIHKEMRILNEHHVTNIIPIKILEGNIKRTLSNLFADGFLEQEVLFLLLNILVKEGEDTEDTPVTYYNWNDPNRYARMVEWILEWNKDFVKEIFPCCNIFHKGHIEYFPSLLETTPFNFTYIVISNQRRHLDESLNSLPDCNREWIQYERVVFLSPEFIPKTGKGIIISIDHENISYLPHILDQREKCASRYAMIINVYTAEVACDGQKLMDRAAFIIREWQKDFLSISDEEMQGHEDFCLMQTDRKVQRIDAIQDVMKIRNSTERWRYLLSDSCYYPFVVHAYHNNPSAHQGVSWLLHQSALKGNNAFRQERLRLVADPALREGWDWEAFYEKKYDWE